MQLFHRLEIDGLYHVYGTAKAIEVLQKQAAERDSLKKKVAELRGVLNQIRSESVYFELKQLAGKCETTDIFDSIAQTFKRMKKATEEALENN
jgi:hypothetical protein